MPTGIEEALAVTSLIGFAGQVFSGCMKMYSIMSGAAHFGEDQDVLFWKLRIQCMRLRVWGDHWTSGDDRAAGLDEALEREDEDIREVVIGTLKRIHQLLDSALHVYKKYGLIIVEPKNDHFALDPEESAKNVQKAVSFWKRCKWQVKNKEKFDGLLQDLTTYNTTLHDILPTRARDTLSVALACGVVDWAQPKELDAVENAFTQIGGGPGNTHPTNSSVIETSSQTDAVASQSIRELVEIKRFGALLADPNRSPSGNEKALSVLCNDPGAFTSPSIAGKGTMSDGNFPQLENGSYHAQTVLVEWKPYDRTMDFRDRMTIYLRVDNLAKFLNKDKPVGFRIPRCVTYVHRDDEARFAFLYRLPDPTTNSTQWTSLCDLFDKSNRRPTLSDLASLEGRYTIAKTLAMAILKLHACGWVHKGIRSSNVLLFPYQSTDPNVLPRKLLDQRYNFIEPLVVGFSYSRPDKPDEDTIERSNNPSRADDHDLYRHPQLIPTASSYRRGLRFSREFDIHALGLVLLEIAFQWPLSHYRRTDDTPETFLARLHQLYVPQLASIMGSKYRDCVAYCLSAVPETPLRTVPSEPGVVQQEKPGSNVTSVADGDSYGDYHLASLTSFFRNVIVPLEKCKIC